MSNISILGTHSDAGKSTITLLVAKILQKQGLSIAPFKAQNVSNNAKVADDSSEIAVAQHFQCEALGVESSWLNNPILLKSGRGSSASLIVKGRAISTPDVREYYRDLDRLKPIVKEAFERLEKRYDVVVIEGAGSPVELNLMDKDLSNIFVSQEFESDIILVADIEKGGVFASIYGVKELLPKDMQKRLKGVIINKFRGDRSLFDDGVEIIQKQFNLPVLGVLPYRALNLGFEDSQSLKNYTQKEAPNAKRVAVISYPSMSNYNDFEPLLAKDDYFIEFISSNIELNSYDMVILPGSKLVIQDLRWLKQSGIAKKILEYKGEILGICGGFEMMFDSISDPFGVEGEIGDRESGLGFIDDEIILSKTKTLKRGEYQIFNRLIPNGFEIHCGVSRKFPLYYDGGRIRGTFVHGLFEDREFLEYKTREIDSFVEYMSRFLDIERIVDIVR